MATVKKGSGTVVRERTKSTAKKAARAERGSSTAPIRSNGGAELTAERIRARAYELFMARGGTHGDDLADWFTAEQELGAKRA